MTSCSFNSLAAVWPQSRNNCMLVYKQYLQIYCCQLGFQILNLLASSASSPCFPTLSTQLSFNLIELPSIYTTDRSWIQIFTCVYLKQSSLSLCHNTSVEHEHNKPHVERRHQSDYILAIFREFEFWDFGWIKIRGVVFLWEKEKHSTN